MSRKRIGDKALTNAERQKRHREKIKAMLAGLTPGKSTKTEKSKSAADERRAAWEAEAKAEKLKAARTEGRRLARQKDKNRRNGFIDGVCSAAAFFVGKDRADITQTLLAYFSIDREKAEAALQEDKRTRNITFSTLDKAGAWEAPPPYIK